jgi:hypothetical protein
MRMIGAIAICAALFAGPALAEETTTPRLALPEPEAAPMALPHTSMNQTASETEPLALPEPETEAIAPYKRCSDRETVYLTN